MGSFCAPTVVRSGSLRRTAHRWVCGLFVLAAYACQSNTGYAQMGPPPSPPVIDNFSAASLGNYEWELEGVVGGSQVGNVSVFFWGAATGTAFTADDGSFSYTLSLNPMFTGGTVYAQATNAYGESSDVVEVYIFSS